MQTVEFKTNMKCQTCLGKVGPNLDAEPRIKSWEADLDDPRKMIRARIVADEDREKVAQAIREAGFEASEVSPDSTPSHGDGSDAVHHAHHESGHAQRSETTDSEFSWSTYKPLALVVVYIIGGTIFAESFYDAFEWSRAMTWFMGFFFVAFAFFKLLDVSKFADAFATYDIIGKRSRAYGLSYPFIELGLGLLFLSGHFLLVANVLTVVIMSIGLVGVIRAVRKKQAIQCACLGTVFNLPMSIVTIIENSTMILMAAAMIWRIAVADG